MGPRCSRPEAVHVAAGCAESLRPVFAITLLRKMAALAARGDASAATPLHRCKTACCPDHLSRSILLPI